MARYWPAVVLMVMALGCASGSADRENLLAALPRAEAEKVLSTYQAAGVLRRVNYMDDGALLYVARSFDELDYDQKRMLAYAALAMSIHNGGNDGVFVYDVRTNRMLASGVPGFFRLH